MATFSKRHYVKLAQAVKQAYDDLDVSDADRLTVTISIGYVVNRIASALQADNPAFDRERFIKACNS